MAPQGRVPLPAHRDGRETLRLRAHCSPAGLPAAAGPHPAPRPAPPSDDNGGKGRGSCSGNGGGCDGGSTPAAVVLQDVWSDPLAVKKQSAAGGWRLTSPAPVGEHVAALPPSGASMALKLPQTVPEGSIAAVPVAATLATRPAAAGPGLCIELRPCGVLHNLTDSPLQASIACTSQSSTVCCALLGEPTSVAPELTSRSSIRLLDQAVQNGISLYEPEQEFVRSCKRAYRRWRYCRRAR